MADDSDRNLNRYIMRFPEGMRERLKAEAERNKRSLNAEIVSRLEASFTGWTSETLDILEHNQIALWDALGRIEKKLGVERPDDAKKFRALIPVEHLTDENGQPLPLPPGSRLSVEID
jgi:hypothetical protein